MDGVDDYVGVDVSNEVVQFFDEVGLLEFFSRDFVHLDTSNNGSLFHIRINVIKPILNSRTCVLRNSIKLQRTNRSKRKPSDLRIMRFAVSKESIDCHDHKLLVVLGVSSEVVINHLLAHYVINRACFDHLCEQSRYIDTQGHVRDYFLNDVSTLVDVFLDLDLS